MLRKMMFPVFLAAAVGVYLYASRHQPGERFITAPVEKGHVTSVIKATGTVEAVTTVDISSQLSGRIADVFVDFNDSVKAGQVIARLDPDIYIARVNEARAALNVAKATEDLQRAAIQRAEAALESAMAARKMEEAQLGAAQAKEDEAERQYQRYSKLLRAGGVSLQDMTQARTQRDVGLASVRAAEEQINLRIAAVKIARAEVSMAKDSLANATAVVEQKRAAVDQAEADRDRTEIRSPIDGVVIKRDVNPGQTVAVSLEAKTLFKIAQDLREMQVSGKIDEADIGRLKVGQTASFTVDAYPGRTFSGRVLQIRKAAETKQNVVTYTAIISAPNPQLLLFPGMTALVRIIVSDTGAILKIPNQALRFRPHGESAVEEPAKKALSLRRSATVWALDGGGRPVPITVSLGASDENSTELAGGRLKEGERLVVGVATPQSRAGILGLRLGF